MLHVARWRAARECGSTTRCRRAERGARRSRGERGDRGRRCARDRSENRHRLRRSPCRSHAAPSPRTLPASGREAPRRHVDTSTSSTPTPSSSSSRRSSVVSSSTGEPPSSVRGCGSKVTTVERRCCCLRGFDHATVAAVDTVERPDRDGSARRLELLWPMCDGHARTPTRSSTSASGRSRDGSNASGVDSVRDGERPDLRPPQRPAVTAERLSDRPHVRAAADAQIQRDHVACIGDDVERVHRRAPAGHLHLDTSPRQPVRALTADLDRRGGRDRQLDLPSEAREPPIELGVVRSLEPLDDLPFRDRRSRYGPSGRRPSDSACRGPRGIARS